MDIIKLQHGYVTQNGCWISYKTDFYGERIKLYQELADELAEFLKTRNIEHSGDFEASHSNESTYRKRCVTIKVTAVFGKGIDLPFAADANN